MTVFYQFMLAHPTLALLMGLAASVGATALMASAFTHYDIGEQEDE